MAFGSKLDMRHNGKDFIGGFPGRTYCFEQLYLWDILITISDDAYVNWCRASAVFGVF